jgi:hypothetical protein
MKFTVKGEMIKRPVEVDLIFCSCAGNHLIASSL